MYTHGEIITAPLFIRSLGTKPTAFRSQPGRRPQPLTLLALRSCSFSVLSRASRLLAQCNRRAVRKNSRLLQPTAWLLGFRGPQPVLTPAARRRRVTRGALCQVPPAAQKTALESRVLGLSLSLTCATCSAHVAITETLTALGRGVAASTSPLFCRGSPGPVLCLKIQSALLHTHILRG